MSLTPSHLLANLVVKLHEEPGFAQSCVADDMYDLSSAHRNLAIGFLDALDFLASTDQRGQAPTCADIEACTRGVGSNDLEAGDSLRLAFEFQFADRA